MTKEFITKAEKYLYSRDHFRELARLDFFKFNDNANNLVVSVNELVASTTLFSSGKNLQDIQNGLYIGNLIVSFCRSHFIASDLILHGELIEAATIIRKQVELLSRLNELRNGLDIEKLIKKTPNLKHLITNFKTLYPDYSGIAHSSNPKFLQLLGETEQKNGVFTTLYPRFQENCYVSMSHLVVSALEFFVWASIFYSEYFQEYNPLDDVALVKVVVETHNKIFNRSIQGTIGTQQKNPADG